MTKTQNGSWSVSKSFKRESLGRLFSPCHDSSTCALTCSKEVTFSLFRCSSRLTATECLQHAWFQTMELPPSVPPAADIADGSMVSNISEVLIRTPESSRKFIDTSVKRQSSIRRTPEMTRKTIECVRRTPETAHKLMVHGLCLRRTPEVTRKSFPSQQQDPVKKLTEMNPTNKSNIEKNEKTRKHSCNESMDDDLISIKEKSRKLSEERPFENRRQTSLRDLSRRSSIDLFVNGFTKKRQTSFRETVKKTTTTTKETSKTSLKTEETLAVPKTDMSDSVNETVVKKKNSNSESAKENLGNLVVTPEKTYQESQDTSRKTQTLSRNLKFFFKSDDSPRILLENPMRKAVSSQTLPIHPMFHRNVDKTVYKCKRIYIDEEMGNNATILIPVNSGQSSMSSISGASSETSSITSDTVSEMSVDSSGDCSSFISSDDSLDYVCKSVWDTGLKAGKVWIKECRGSFERALSRFNLEKPSSEEETTGVGGVGGSPSPRRYQKNGAGLNRKSMYMSSPILNKIGNLGSVGCTDPRKYGLQLMKEGTGNVVVIREVKAGRYTKFSELKCESVQSRIKKLQDQKG